MPRINLLPWREAARKERQRKFTVIAGGMAFFSALVVLFVHLQMSAQIEEQNSRNKFLENTIAEVDKQIEEIKTLKKDKEDLLARMNIIQALQTSRPEIVHLFAELAQSAPENAFLLKIDRKGKALALEGVANSNAGVSALMRNLDGSEWLDNPKLAVIDSSKNEFVGASWFSLTVNEAIPNAANSEENKP